jgi:hypothetical protein
MSSAAAVVAVSVCLVFHASAVDFVLREQLGYGWSNACVTFSLKPEQAGMLRKGGALLGPGGKTIPCQLAEEGGLPQIAFQADLAPYTTAEYVLAPGGSRLAADLEAVDAGGVIRLANSRIGIELRKALKAGEGPVARIRLGSGVWTGGSSFAGGAPVKAYAVELTARGPVFAEAVCRASFADGGTWTLRFRVEAAEPVVLVEEQFDAPGGGLFRVALGDKAFQPTHLMHRNADVTSSALMADPVADYFLEPWLHWNNPRHGNWIALYTPSAVAPAWQARATADIKAVAPDATVDALAEEMKPTAKHRDANPDMLVAGLLKPSLWRDPKWAGRSTQIDPSVQALVKDGLMTLEMPVQGGRRKWMLGALDKDASEELLMGKNRRVAPPPQKLVVKHGDFPLDQVKDFVLDCDGDADNHPVLYIRKQDLPALKARLKSNPAELKRWTGEQPIDKYFLDGPIREFIASGDVRLGKMMAARGLDYLQTCTDWYLRQDERQTPGAAPHMQSLILSTLNLLDPVMSTDAVAPEARKRILARIAFLGYVVNSPDYWSQERGYCGFANMSSIVALYQTALGCMVPSHPKGREWGERGLNELHRELLAWSDADGGWLEAPHYAMVTFDHILGGFTMGHNAGYGDYVYDPRMRKVIEWFAAISTPGDSRTGGFRHHPPIGNTYHGEPTGAYGILAGLWKARDPDFASRMQWMYEQNGSFAGLGIGWNFPTMLGYQFLFSQHGVAARPASCGSGLFRETGVVLRDAMGSGRETYLHMIAGSNHDHYDVDSGSMVLYGKGRILADDWGYIGRHPEQWHSMLTSASAWGGGLMRIEAFAPGAALDYVSGRKGSWQRQIAFIKDAVPGKGPAFFLIRDTQSADEPSTWRLWLTALKDARPDAVEAPASVDVAASMDALSRKGNRDDSLTEGLEAKRAKPAAPAGPGVTVHARGATLVGGEDVDMDIFIYEAATLGLKTETATQKVTCGYRNGKVDAMANTQTALIGTLAGRGAVSALLVPRLKTEAVPTVTWFAEGRGVEVTSAAGTDVVFLAPPRRRASEPDGKSLLPLFGFEPVAGKRGGLVYKPVGADMPQLTVNTSGTALAEGSYAMPAGAIAVHPAPTNPVTVVWQSPVSGSVTVEAVLWDADAGGGDGVAYELRSGATVFKQGVVTNGSEAVAVSCPVPVAKGDLVRLVVLPRATNWWDTTCVEMVVRPTGGSPWSLREAVVSRKDFGNAQPGAAGAAWWVCEGDAAAFDPKALAPSIESHATLDGTISFEGSSAAVQVRGGKTTMTLGAGGKIRAHGGELAAGGPATKTETR